MSNVGVRSPAAALCLLEPVATPTDTPKYGPVQLYGACGSSSTSAGRATSTARACPQAKSGSESAANATQPEMNAFIAFFPRCPGNDESDMESTPCRPLRV